MVNWLMFAKYEQTTDMNKILENVLEDGVGVNDENHDSNNVCTCRQIRMCLFA